MAKLIDRALRKTPRDADAWSVRRMAEKVSKSAVPRRFSLFGVKPHRGKTSKPSRSSSRQSGMCPRRTEAAGQRARALRRREEPDTGARTEFASIKMDSIV